MTDDSGQMTDVSGQMTVQGAAQRLYEGFAYVRTGERTLGPFTLYDYEKDLR
jgi:hypothetical protein